MPLLYCLLETGQSPSAAAAQQGCSGWQIMINTALELTFCEAPCTLLYPLPSLLVQPVDDYQWSTEFWSLKFCMADDGPVEY